MPRSTSIHIEAQGLNELMRALREFGNPGFQVTSELEAVLGTVFDTTQDRVHVISGRLKASGTTSTDFDGNTWTGTISYGGPSGTPAYYGVYEQARGGTRPDGTPHDFFAGLEVFAPAFEAAIDRHFNKLG